MSGINNLSIYTLDDLSNVILANELLVVNNFSLPDFLNGKYIVGGIVRHKLLSSGVLRNHTIDNIQCSLVNSSLGGVDHRFGDVRYLPSCYALESTVAQGLVFNVVFSRPVTQIYSMTLTMSLSIIYSEVPVNFFEFQRQDLRL